MKVTVMEANTKGPDPWQSRRKVLDRRAEIATAMTPISGKSGPKKAVLQANSTPKAQNGAPTI